MIRQLVALDVFRFVGTQASAQDWPTFIISELEKEKVAQRPGAQSQLAGGGPEHFETGWFGTSATHVSPSHELDDSGPGR